MVTPSPEIRSITIPIIILSGCSIRPMLYDARITDSARKASIALYTRTLCSLFPMIPPTATMTAAAITATTASFTPAPNITAKPAPPMMPAQYLTRGLRPFLPIISLNLLLISS